MRGFPAFMRWSFLQTAVAGVALSIGISETEKVAMERWLLLLQQEQFELAAPLL